MKTKTLPTNRGSKPVNPFTGPSRQTTVRSQPVAGPDASRLRIKRILAPTDFSDYSKKALHYAVRFAEQFGATLTVLHVVEPVIPTTDGFGAFQVPAIDVGVLQKNAAASLASLVGDEVDELVPVKTLVRCGPPSQEIVSVAKDEDIDLIIIATHGYTGLKHLLLGSTAERVVRHAPCPVLTVREREHEFA
jgi:universal stress protein A